jgi:hypothetical protein
MPVTIVGVTAGAVITFLSTVQREGEPRLYRVRLTVIAFGQTEPDKVLALADGFMFGDEQLIRVGPRRLLPERVKSRNTDFASVLSNYMRLDDIDDELSLPESARQWYRRQAVKPRKRNLEIL